MTTFIPFGSPNGNPKFIQTGVFSEGQEIKVKATGTLAGATGDLTKESAPVAIQAASAWASVPLNSSTTTYGMHMGDYVTNSTPNYQPMAWITFQGDDFTNAGLNIVGTQPTNNINTPAAALVYENMMFTVAMSRLAAQGVLPSSATPICFDPEDVGVDKALFYHDIYSAWVDEGQPAGSTSFASDLRPYDQDGVTGLTFPGTDITTSAPLIIQMFKNLKERINAIYPNSPVGFYSVGSAAFWLTGWSGVYKNSTNSANSLYKSYEIMERMFDGNLSETGNWWGYQTMDVLDFVFNSYYPALNDTGKMPFVRYDSKLELLKNFLNLFIDKFAGTSQGAKMMIGVSAQANVSPSDLSSQDVIYSAIAKNDTSLTVAGEPVDWYNSTLDYPDFNSVPKITNSSLNSDFVYTPMAMQGDLVKWMNLLPTDSAPAGFQSAPAAASPAGAEAALSQLSGSLRDFPMAIWDGAYTATGFYQGVDNDLYGPTLTSDQVETFRGVYTKHTIMDAYTNSGQTTNPYGSWLATQLDADAATYITMFSTKGSQNWYQASPSGFSPSDIPNLVNWYDFSDASPLTNKGTPLDGLTGNLSEIGGTVPTTTINSLTAMNVGAGIALGTEFQNSDITNAGSTVFMVMKSTGSQVIPINEGTTFSLACDSGSSSTSLGSLGGTTYVNGVADAWTTRGQAATALLTGSAVVYTASACDLGWLQGSGLSKVMEFGGYAGFDDLTAYGEILIYTNVLTALQQADVEQYLMDKWSEPQTWESESPQGALYSDQLTGTMTTGATLIALPGVTTNVFDNGSTNGFRWNNGLIIGNYPTDVGAPASNVAVWNVTDSAWWAPPVTSTVSYDSFSGGYKWSWDGSDSSILSKEIIAIGYDHYVDPIGDSWPDYDGPTVADYSFEADLGAYSSGNKRYPITNVTEAGDVAEFNPTANGQPLRYNTAGNDGISLLIGKTGTINENTPGLAAKIYADTGSGFTEFAAVSTTFGDISGTLLTIQWDGVGSPGTAGTFWDSLSQGDSIKVELSWD